jgi:hypothetical protein
MRSSSETARVHRRARWRGGVADPGTPSESPVTAGRIPELPFGRRPRGTSESVPHRAEECRIRRWENVAIEFRWAGGHYDQLPTLAADLVRARVAVMVTVGGDQPAFAAKAASPTIPIVFMVGSKPCRAALGGEPQPAGGQFNRH